jgi:hypothetical protein
VEVPFLRETQRALKVQSAEVNQPEVFFGQGGTPVRHSP